MELEKHLAFELRQHAEALNKLEAVLTAPFLRVVVACTTAIHAGHKILLFGNGGQRGRCSTHRHGVHRAFAEGSACHRSPCIDNGHLYSDGHRQ